MFKEQSRILRTWIAACLSLSSAFIFRNQHGHVGERFAIKLMTLILDFAPILTPWFELCYFIFGLSLD
jgi:hypothetical protein